MSTLKETLKKLDKKYAGEIVEMDSTDEGRMVVEGIPTSCYSLDKVFGCGGLPRGRIVEVFGEESSGKSTLAMFLVAAVQKQGGKAVWIDAEYAFSKDYAQKLGVSMDDFIVIQPQTAEEALDTIAEVVKTNEIDVVVLDSVAALVPKAELEGDISDQQMAVAARLMSKALRIVTGNVSKTKTSIIFINQMRDKIGVFFGNKHTTPGGKALKFFASVRIEVKKGKLLKDKNEDVIGNWLICVGVKNKVGLPFRRAEFELYYERGVDVVADILDQAVAQGAIGRTGNTYNYGETKIGVGRDQAKEFLAKAEQADLLKEIKAKLN